MSFFRWIKKNAFMHQTKENRRKMLRKTFYGYSAVSQYVVCTKKLE